jgi:ribonuclease HI
LNNGGADPRAGCAFVFRPAGPTAAGSVSFRLENQGPTGQQHPQTSNRAELRAVIGALRFRAWTGEGCKTLVIATDSEYVVNGATTWLRTWLRNGWKIKSGASVKNKDLWEALLTEFEEHHRRGLIIKFWRIPRELNIDADQLAKNAAREPCRETFGDILGVLV